MIALLPNSGRGTRMGSATREHPKCMVELPDGETIIARQVHQLLDCGVTEAVVTTGPFADLLREHLEGLHSGMRFTFVHNPRYAETNYIYSMYLARQALTSQDIISLHGDLVMDSQVLRSLARSAQSVVAVDRAAELPEKDFKAEITNGGRVRAIGIDRFGADCAAGQPAYKFLAKDFDRWMQEIVRFIDRGEDTCYAENAFNAAWEEIPLFALDVQGLTCKEIDTPEDYAAVTPTLPPR